ncbi:MAG: hypothetical protein ACLFSQ_12095 [Candidatus Zixiibacteriota bacterium]
MSLILILSITASIVFPRCGITFVDGINFYNGPGEAFQIRDNFTKFKFFEILDVESDWVYARANGNLGYFHIDQVREVKSERKMIGQYSNVVLLMAPTWESDTITVVNEPIEVDYVWTENDFAFIQINGSGVWVYETAIEDLPENPIPKPGNDIQFENNWRDESVTEPDMPILNSDNDMVSQKGKYNKPTYINRGQSGQYQNSNSIYGNSSLRIPRRDDRWKKRQLWLGFGFSGIDLDKVDIPIYRASGLLYRNMSEEYSIDKDKVNYLIPLSIRGYYLIEELNVFFDFGGCFSFHPTEEIYIYSLEGGSGLALELNDDIILDTRVCLGYSYFQRVFKEKADTKYMLEKEFPHLAIELGLSTKIILPLRAAIGLRYTEDFNDNEVEFDGKNDEQFHFYDDDYDISMNFRGPYIKLEMGILP